VKGDRLHLIHIKECIENIQAYTAEGRGAFFADAKTQDAVLRRLQTLGESSRRLSDGLKNEHPGVDWRGIAAFRNVVVHDYLGIDFKQVWDIVESDLPALKDEVAVMLEDLKE